MANSNVSDFSVFINEQIKAQEQIETYLWRLEALIAVAVMTDDFYDLSDTILHNYFSIAGDLIEEAVKLTRQALANC